MAQTGQTWLMVHAGLTGFILVPTIVVWLATLCLARRREDPARESFIWLKACHPLFLLCLFLVVASDVSGIILMSWQSGDGSFDEAAHPASAVNSLDQTYQYSGLAATLFRNVVNALFVILFAELGNGFRYAQSRRHPRFRNRIRIAAFLAATVLFALSVVYFAVPLAASVQYNETRSALLLASLQRAWNKAKLLGAALNIISFVVSIVQVVYAWFVVVQYAGLPARKSAVLYLVSTILDAVRWVFLTVLLGKWHLHGHQAPHALTTIEPVFDSWIRFVILMLLLVIGTRGIDGLWGIMQHWTQAEYPQPPASSYDQAPLSRSTYYQPQQHEYPAWQCPQSNPDPYGAWNVHELATPQQVAQIEELEARQTQQPVYYSDAYQMPGVSGRKEGVGEQSCKAAPMP
ncbi:hypothetical protein ED733_003402 [Metarhizium rileyi]|uniref:Uncharacterized protein n=1 Tax=Metarhizium rileyi (strain RCEF 4871) TaxID=1649241 RepID=A0A5C6G6I6_METRR|nr:hypothetical protein ED733_003402 [Metarhizium rileyi]